MTRINFFKFLLSPLLVLLYPKPVKGQEWKPHRLPSKTYDDERFHLAMGGTAEAELRETVVCRVSPRRMVYHVFQLPPDQVPVLEIVGRKVEFKAHRGEWYLPDIWKGQRRFPYRWPDYPRRVGTLMGRSIVENPAL